MKTKSLFLAGFLSLFAETISAQVTFQQLYRGAGEYEGFFAEQTTAGGYVVAGRNFLVKTDSNGSLLWSRTYNSGNIKCVHQTSDGGTIMAGYAYSAGGDGYVLKTDSLGNVLWSKTIGGAEYEEIYYVEETTDGGYILSGEARDSLNIMHLYLVKLDGAGNQQWSKLFGRQTENKVKQTVDGGYIIAGTTIGGCGGYNGSLFKTDSLGNLLWTKNYCDTYIDEFSFTDVCQTTDGGYIISGSVRLPGSIFNADFFLMKTDSSGSVIWQNAYAGNHSGSSALYAVQQVTDGYIAAGLSTDFNVILRAAVLVKTDTAGILVWSKAYGDAPNGVHFAKSVQQTTDRGYILGGHVIPVGAMGTDKYFYLIKTDSSGNSGCREANIYPWTWTTTMQGVLVSSTTSAGESSAPLAVSATSGAAAYDYCNFSFTDVKEYPQETFAIYPNPFRGNFTVSFFKTLDNASITIFNTLGEKVYSRVFSGKQESIESELAKGIYFICITDGKERWTQKIIKQ
jgi:hypothetical protein